MRPIKFRAWEKTAHHMLNNITVSFSGTVMFGLPNREYEIMQFTGLFDKNGKEIWEGDIVQNYYRNDPYKIIFYDGSFRGWYGRKEEPSQDMRGFAFDELEGKGSEVIGDVYSTPELLKEGK